jgi:hypothetical protein
MVIKVSPSTHGGGKYAFEECAVGGQSDVNSVLLDSVQSQVNTFEDVLLSDARAGDIRIPLLQNGFSRASDNYLRNTARLCQQAKRGKNSVE